MNESQNKFVWYDLMTSDVSSAAEFYKSVNQWDAKDAGGDYTIFSAGKTDVAGLMPDPAGSSTPFGVWSGYVGVDNVDVYAVKVVEAGGKIIREPSDIPGVGRFAVVADPFGAWFFLFQPNGSRPETEGASADTPGHIGWHELYSDNWEAAFAFYEKLFGWTKVSSFDMGDMGTYQLFAIDGVPVGGMMNKGGDVPESHWLYYFTVDALDSAVARVTAGGGQVCQGPDEVPGGQWIAQCTDPQGGKFALVAYKR